MKWGIHKGHTKCTAKDLNVAVTQCHKSSPSHRHFVIRGMFTFFFVNHPKKWWFYDIGLRQKTDDETQAIFCGTIEKSNPRHSIGECVGGTIGESWVRLAYHRTIIAQEWMAFEGKLTFIFASYWRTTDNECDSFRCKWKPCVFGSWFQAIRKVWVNCDCPKAWNIYSFVWKQRYFWILSLTIIFP